ncbi:uncharacterized protein F5891DRAFT_123820 [Suillus fuscotomentosus]|uniref:Uncharacterized protein n=1 Tax=Suillus fuscotomentosus TaxID=1912939 RepID=A0AAD4DSR3_9AGAM|nr:uncharacterized protein F5891DRAFT_123820 [Suillus fuscotomentosus]KAG1890483.1 hypothetical protein F5891DRAFT_123820 [Suillus fuscotomentosus]
MRFSSAIVLVVVATLTSAMPHDDGSLLARKAQCSTFCTKNSQCQGCPRGYCTPLFCQVRRVSALTSVQYVFWH